MGNAMTRDAYIKSLFAIYTPVNVLSEKNGGTVLRLRNKSTDQDLILRSYPKRLDAYELLCSILCENLPEIYDAIDLDDGQIVLEEFIDGITVAQVMQTGKYRYRGAKKVIRGICNALTVLHERDIIHRDIKPENVMIDKNGRVVLIDFNTARKESLAGTDTVIMGTVGYAAPEQLGLTQTDARTDIYATGVLLNVMLTGKHPTEVFAPGRAGRIVRKCTTLNPNDRYQSAGKLSAAL